MAKGGAKVWYFPDGYLPEKIESGKMEAHEALMLLNCGNSPAQVKLDFYFEDKDPVKDIPVKVDRERVRTLRLDHPEDIGGLAIPPLTQYSIRVRSDVDIVVQFGRLDTTQNNMSYYCGIGYCANE
ncbi:MAG: sensory rhodopsin transducer [Armatimonadota bacterium]